MYLAKDTQNRDPFAATGQLPIAPDTYPAGLWMGTLYLVFYGVRESW